MHSSAGGADQGARIPRLAPGWEERGKALSPAEGFLLSRIDGHTSWALLRQIGGLPPEEVDHTLEAWVSAGLVVVDAAELATDDQADPPGGSSASAAAPEPEEAAIDPSLELDPDLQRRILALELRLDDAGYHELLGVDRGADARAIKLAYFRLSKEYHPDRYFRRKIGDFDKRLDRIFKRVVEAYELLSDPTTRAEIERTMPPPPPRAAPEEGAYREAGAGRSDALEPPPQAPGGYRKPSRMENLERLRRRFKIPKKILAERQFKARQFFQAAQVAAHQKSWLEAAASARLAIAFDPWNRSYKEGFANIQSEVHKVRADDLVERAEQAPGRDALRLLEEALHYRPSDGALNLRVARLALEAGEVERALEYAADACDLAPDDVASHVTLCRALRRSGRTAEAREALGRAAHLEPKNPDVLAEDRFLKRGVTR